MRLFPKRLTTPSVSRVAFAPLLVARADNDGAAGIVIRLIHPPFLDSAGLWTSSDRVGPRLTLPSLPTWLLRWNSRSPIKREPVIENGSANETGGTWPSGPAGVVAAGRDARAEEREGQLARGTSQRKGGNGGAGLANR
jgi:hypothetical protein